jgi:hypothetical protein
LLIACTLGVAGGYLVWFVQHDDGSASLPDPTAATDQPLLGGRQVTLEAAVTGFGLPLLRPDSELASDSSLTQVWLATDDVRAVALIYESGIRVYLTPWPAGNPLSPEQFYSQQASATAAGRTQTINGAVAWVAPANAQATGVPPEAFIDFVVNGIEVSLRGASFSVDDLVKVAETVGAPTITGESARQP